MIDVDYKRLMEENKFLKRKLDKANSQLFHVQRQLDNERQTVRELKTEQVNYASGKNDLECLFMECVEEVKKEITKRRD